MQKVPVKEPGASLPAGEQTDGEPTTAAAAQAQQQQPASAAIAGLLSSTGALKYMVMAGTGEKMLGKWACRVCSVVSQLMSAFRPLSQQLHSIASFRVHQNGCHCLQLR